MHHSRRPWFVIVLLIGTLGAALPALAADIETLRLATAPAAEAVRYLVADALVTATSLLALVAVFMQRSWVLAAILGWMVILLIVVGWVLFVAVGSNGPPVAVRLGIWTLCAVLGALAVHLIRRSAPGREPTTEA